MGFALQWHTAHSGSEPIVAATDRPQYMDLQGEVLVVTCEIRRGDSEDTHAAGALARDIVETYYSACPDADAPQSDEVIAERIADAITLSAGRIALSAGMDSLFDPTDEVACNILAVAVHGRTLLAARSGDGQVYLLRNAELQRLTASEVDPADPLELGKLELRGEDRVLVCTSALGDALKPIDLQRILKAQPSSRRTAHALLDAAEQACELQDGRRRQIGLAVVDFINGKPGVFPTRLDIAPARTRVAALPLAIVASITLIAAIAAASTMAPSAQQSAAANANALPALVQITANAPKPAAQPLPAVQAGMPGVGPVVVEPDSALPKLGAMATATAQPVLPRKSAPGPTFLRNIRAKPPASASPTPTALALASTSESASAPIALTDDVGVDQATATPAPTAQPAPVKRPLRRVLEIEPRTAAITLGEALALSAEVRDENGMVVTSDVVTWQPSETVIAADARSAVFSTSTSGTFTVTASLGDLRGQATIVVLIPLEAAAAALSMTVDSPSHVPLSTTAALTATATIQPATELPPQTPTAQPIEPPADATLVPTPAPTLDPTVPPTFAPTPVLTQTTAEPIPTPEG